MIVDEPVLYVLAATAAAATVAALGTLPLVGRDRVPTTWLGWANATAAGAMLASAYVLAQAGLEEPPLTMGLGGLVGIAFVHWSRAFAGTQELDLNRLDDRDPSYGYQVWLASTIHSAAEGLAIGGAMAIDLSLGTFVVVAIALHNIPEATILAAVFRGRGDSLGHATLVAVVSEASLVVTAVATFAVVAARPEIGGWVMGFASGSLIYLVTVDLLPESYREAGSTSIALVTILAMGSVIALQRLVG